jgi:hypothetical protein
MRISTNEARNCSEPWHVFYDYQRQSGKEILIPVFKESWDWSRIAVAIFLALTLPVDL